MPSSHSFIYTIHISYVILLFSLHMSVLIACLRPDCCFDVMMMKISYALYNDSTTRMGALLIKIIQHQSWRTHKQKHNSSFAIFTHRILAKDLTAMEGITALRAKPSYRNANHSHDAIITALR